MPSEHPFDCPCVMCDPCQVREEQQRRAEVDKWAVEKARKWRVRLLGPVTNPSGESLDGKIEASLAALLEEVAGEAFATVQPALDAEKRERDEARAEVAAIGPELDRARSLAADMEHRALAAEVEVERLRALLAACEPVVFGWDHLHGEATSALAQDIAAALRGGE